MGGLVWSLVVLNKAAIVVPITVFSVMHNDYMYLLYGLTWHVDLVCINGSFPFVCIGRHLIIVQID